MVEPPHFHVYEPDSNSWGKVKSPNTLHQGGAAGVIDGKMYVVGGRERPRPGALLQPIGALSAYDPATNSWTARKPMPTPRSELAAAVINGKLYAVGGADRFGNALKTVEVYDPGTDTWMSLPPLPQPRQGHAVVAIGKTLYVIGGGNDKGPVGTVEELDVSKIGRPPQ